MNRFIYTVLLLLSIKINSSYADSCPSFEGQWGKCTISTALVSQSERFVLNQILKPYQLTISEASRGIRFLSTYKKPFQARYTLSDQTIKLNVFYESRWEETPDGSTPPVFQIYSKCQNRSFDEEIVWENLDEYHYSANHLEKFDKYYKTKLKIENGRLVKKFYSSRLKDSKFRYIATLSCSSL